MSTIFTYESEFTCVISPTRLCKAFVLDADNLIPKTAPQAGLEGDGDAGTIKKISFRGASSYSSTNNIIDGRVMDILLSSNCVIEDAPDSIEKICYESKLVASGNKGTNVSMSAGSTASYTKHSFNDIDKVNFVSSYSVIDGAPDSMKKICYETKLMASGSGAVASGSGTVNKKTGEYRVKGDVEIKAGHVKAGKEKVL